MCYSRTKSTHLQKPCPSTAEEDIISMILCTRHEAGRPTIKIYITGSMSFEADPPTVLTPTSSCCSLNSSGHCIRVYICICRKTAAHTKFHQVLGEPLRYSRRMKRRATTSHSHSCPKISSRTATDHSLDPEEKQPHQPHHSLIKKATRTMKQS